MSCISRPNEYSILSLRILGKEGKNHFRDSYLLKSTEKVAKSRKKFSNLKFIIEMNKFPF